MITLINWVYVKIRYIKFKGKGKLLRFLWNMKLKLLKKKYESK